MFYVYVHRRADTNKVFYVGKGKRDRATSKQRNQYWKRIVALYGYTIEIVINGMQENKAHQLEMELISFYGKENLANLTDGGEGRSGSKHSESTKKKISQKLVGIEKTAATKLKMKEAQNKHEAKELRRVKSLGKVFTDVTKSKISEKAIQQHNNPEQSAKLVKAIRVAIAKKILCVELGICFYAIADAENFLVQTFNIKQGAGKNINAVARGKRKSAYGYTWQYI